MAIVLLAASSPRWPRRPNMLEHDLELDLAAGRLPADERTSTRPSARIERPAVPPAATTDLDRELERRIAARRKELRQHAMHPGGDET